MKIGRARFADGSTGWFATEDGLSFSTWDPDTGQASREVEISRILSPVVPSKIVAVGLNYRDHAEELSLDLPKEPILFIKPSTSVIGPDDEIIYPDSSSRVDYEAELAVVIGKTCRFVKRADAQEYILGYTCFNDVTARDLQVSDGQWTRAKSFDTFAPVGPWIVTDIDDPHRLAISSRVNGELRQSSTTENLIFDVFDLVEFISTVMTLHAGDILATGTPSGIGPMQRGDEISIEIEGLGVLRNTVV